MDYSLVSKTEISFLLRELTMPQHLQQNNLLGPKQEISSVASQIVVFALTWWQIKANTKGDASHTVL
jgi:hypothetical protein